MHLNMDHLALRTHQEEQQEDVHLPTTDLVVTELVDLRCASYIGLTPALLHHTTTIPHHLDLTLCSASSYALALGRSHHRDSKVQ